MTLKFNCITLVCNPLAWYVQSILVYNPLAWYVQSIALSRL